MKKTKRLINISFLLVALAMFAVGYTARAATITANTGTEYDWSSTSAWSGGVVPTSDDNVVIPASATITVDGDYTITNLTIQSTGVLKPKTSGEYTLTIKGTVTTTGAANYLNLQALNSNGRLNVTFDNSAVKAITCSNNNNMYFNDLTINEGAAVTIDKSFKIYGDLTLNDNSSFTQSSGTVTITGPTTSITVPSLGSLSLDNVYLASTAANVTTSSNITITGGYFHVASGAKFTASSGTITFQTTSSDGVSGLLVSPVVASGQAGDLKFASVVFSLSSSTFAPASNFTITGNFDKSGTGLFEPTAGTIVFDNNASSNSPKTISANSRLSFFNLKVTDGSAVQTASSATINGGSTGGNSLTVEGSGFFRQTAGTMTFYETSSSANAGLSVSNSATCQLNNLTVFNTSNCSFYTTSDVTLTGNLTIGANSSATFASPSTVYFTDYTGQTGTKTIDNNSPGYDGLRINNLVLEDNINQTTVSLSGSSTLTLTGDLTVYGNSSLTCANSSTVSFRGGTPKTITNQGTLSFYDLDIQATSGNVVNTSSDFTISNDLFTGSSSTSGALNASGNSVITFTKNTDPIRSTSSSSNALSFQSVKFSGTAPDDQNNANSFIVKGDLIIPSGTSVSFTNSSGTITFAGTSEQRIKIDGSAKLGNIVLNNASGLVLEGSFSMGDANNSATLTLTDGDLDLNGDYTITFSHTGCALVEGTGKTIVNSKQATTGGYIATSSSCDYDDINHSGIGIQGLTSGTSITVRRYPNSRTIEGLNTISRYYYISGTSVQASSAAKFYYDESELNGNDEDYLTLYWTTASNANASEYTSSSSATSTKWYGLSGTVSTSSNYVSKAFSLSLADGYYVAAPRFLKISYLPKESIEERNKLADSPLAADAEDKIIFGFGITASSDMTLNSSGTWTALTVNLNRSPVGIFSDFTLRKDNDADASTYGMSSVKAGSVSGNSVQFTNLNSGSGQTFTAGQTEYYFVTADVDPTVSASTNSIYAYVDQDDFTFNNIYKMSQTVNGQSYSFASLSVQLSTSNAPSSGPIELNSTAQEVFGFNLTPPDGAGTVTFNSVNIKMTVENGAEYDDFQNFKLYKDANKNGVKDDGDTQVGSTITNIDETTGILSFSSLSQSLTAGESTNYILVMDVKSDANVNGTVKFKIDSYSDVNLTSPATIPSGGPYQGNTMTVRNAPIPGSPTKLSIIAFSMKTLDSDDDKSKGENEVIKSENLVVKVQAQDADGYPQKVDQATTITLTPLGGATLGGTTTISLSVNQSTGTNSALQFSTASTSNQFSLIAKTTSGMSLTPDTITNITVYSTEPSSFFTGASASSIGATTATIAWTNSSSENALVVMKAGSEPNAPEDGTDYNASSNFSSPASSNGTTGTGSVVVYEGTGSSVNVTGLSANTTYYVRIYKFNGSGLGTNYLTSESAGGSYNTNGDLVIFKTKYSEPTSASSNLTFSSVQADSMKITWTKPSSGGGTYSLAVIGTSDPSTTPTDTVTYEADATYGDGDAIGTGSTVGYVVYNGTGNSVTVKGLSPDTKYYVRIYEYNGTSGKENYLTTQYLSGSRYTLSAEPTVQASEVNFSDMTLGTNTTIRVNWVRGNGDRCLVVGKAGSAITSNETPQDQTARYTSETSQTPQFGTTTALGQGYVLYDGTANNITVSGLQYGETYYFKVFEYNYNSSEANTTSDNSTVNYNTSDATDNPNSRIADSYEPNDELSDAKFISSNGTLYQGIISSATDVDWFSFRPDFENSYDNVRIKLTGLPQNYTLELYRADGRLLRRSKISGTGDEVIIINNLPEADYYVKIYSADGEYSLTPYRVYVLNRVLEYKADTP